MKTLPESLTTILTVLFALLVICVLSCILLLGYDKLPEGARHFEALLLVSPAVARKMKALLCAVALLLASLLSSCNLEDSVESITCSETHPCENVLSGG